MNALTFAQVLAKGHPEFDPDQPRNEDGTWSAGDARGSSRDNLKLEAIRSGSLDDFTREVQRRIGNEATVRGTIRNVEIGFLAQTTAGNKSLGMTYSRRLGELHVGLISAPDTFEGARWATAVIKFVRDFAKTNDVEAIKIEAGLTMGGYLWPRLGFEHDGLESEARLAQVVQGRLQNLATDLPKVQYDEAAAIILAGGPSMATKLAHLDYPLSEDFKQKYPYAEGVRGALTLGKVLLTKTGGEYVLRKSNFSALNNVIAARIGKFDKGYPEYDPAQERAEDGKWTDGDRERDKLRAPFDVRGQRVQQLEESLTKLLPEGMKASVISDQRTREIRIFKPLNPNDPRSRDAASSLFKISRSGVMIADLFEAENTPAGQAAAKAIMRAMYHIAMDSNVQVIKLQAGLSHGGYFWPRLGFELSSVNEVNDFVVGARQAVWALWMNGHIQTPLYRELTDMLNDARRAGDKTIAARFAQRDDPLASSAGERFPGFSIRGRLTVSKYVMAHGGGSYELPRSKFHILKPFVGRGLTKGNPEFNPEQPRAPDGTWTDTGESRRERRATLDIRQLSKEQLAYALHERTGRRLRAQVRGDYPKDFFVVVSDLNAGIKFKVKDSGKVIDASYFEAPDSAEGRATAVRIMMALRDLAVASGTEKIVTFAGLSMGGYLWPRVGFELDPDGQDYQLDWQVSNRARKLLGFNLITQEEYDTIDKIVLAKGSLWPTRIAALDRPMSLRPGELLSAVERVDLRGQLTLGKVLLAGTNAHYMLPRARFSSLGRLAKPADLTKGRPEYDDDQPRGEDGKWILGQFVPANRGPKRQRQVLSLAPVDLQIGEAATAEEVKSARRYCGIEGVGLNKHLRMQGVSDPAIEQYIARLDEFVQRARLKVDAYVYRGVSGFSGHAFLNSLRLGDTVVDNGFVSASMEPAAARRFQGFLLGGIIRIKLPAGARVGPAFMHSRLPSEREVILPRGATFTYVDRNPNDKFYDFEYQVPATKGYPEFSPGQERDERGRWTDGGGPGDMRRKSYDRAKLMALVYRYLPDARAQFFRSTGDYGIAELRVETPKLGFRLELKPGGDLFASDMESKDTTLGSRAQAAAAIAIIRRIAIDSGADAITARAGDVAGGYLWPYLGFQLEDDEDPVQYVRGEVERRLLFGQKNNWFTGEQVTKVRSILEEGGVDMATKIARLSDPVPAKIGQYMSGSERFVENPTLGKAMLMGTSSRYRLPRDRFVNLARFEKSVTKGNPEFNPDQPRNEDGTWAGGSGKQPIDHASEAALSRSLQARFPGAGVAVTEYGGGYDVAIGDDHNIATFFIPKTADSPLTFEQIKTDPAQGGNAFARAALQAVLDAAVASGASNIRLQAAGAGGYVWPMVGFELDSDKEDPVAYFLENSGVGERIKRYRSMLGWGDRRAFDRVIKEGGLDLPARLAAMDTVLTSDQMQHVSGNNRYLSSTAKPTLGKALLVGTRGNYTLPKANYSRLQRYIDRV